LPTTQSTNLRIPHNIEKGHDVGATGKILQNLDLSLNLLLLDGLQNLDDAFLVVDNVDALKNLRVFSSACEQPRVNNSRKSDGRGRGMGGHIPILRTTS
jgi:hypothetical protein